jgi:hypothetical protein
MIKKKSDDRNGAKMWKSSTKEGKRQKRKMPEE